MLEVPYKSPKLPFISQAQLEKMVTKLKVEKAQVEASLREEEAKCGMLLKEVKDANEVSLVASLIGYCSAILKRMSMRWLQSPNISL